MDKVTKNIEELFPQCTDELMKNFDRAYDLWCRKQSDYGSSNISLGLNLSSSSSESFANNRLAQLGVVIRMNDKICRLVNLYKKSVIMIRRDGADPIYKINSEVKESIEDTSTDIMNYANMLMVLRAGKWGR